LRGRDVANEHDMSRAGHQPNRQPRPEGGFETMIKERVDAVFVVAGSLTGRGRAAPMLLAQLAMPTKSPNEDADCCGA
jgi:hypothetical protein